jgi:hypothetical protein
MANALLNAYISSQYSGEYLDNRKHQLNLLIFYKELYRKE